MNEPQPGHYADSLGTVYAATRKGKPPQWFIQRLAGRSGHRYTDAAFLREDFPKAVRAGIFTAIPETI